MLNLSNPAYESNEPGNKDSDTHEAHDKCSSDCGSHPVESNETDAVSNHGTVEAKEHCHVIGNDWIMDKKRNQNVWRKLITVLIMCVVFMVAEIIGGIIAKSIAIQTDAAHMAADIAGFFLAF